MEITEISIKDINLPQNSHIHFVGIGGSSMSGLAMIMAAKGYRITGSDISESDSVRTLRENGITVFTGHNAANVQLPCSLVVFTIAVGDENPEVCQAAALGIPVIERGKFLGYLTQEHEYSLAVSGTHGKTTTTAMVSSILIDAGLDPSVHIGGKFSLIGASYRVAASDYFVTEACEYHSNFLNLRPHCGIILNVDEEHLDWFGTYDNIKNAFTEFASNISPDGFVVVCSDWPDAVECAKKGSKAKVITYSASKPADGVKFGRSELHYWANNVVLDKCSGSFSLFCNDSYVTTCTLKVPGMHNISNAVAAAAAALNLGCSPSQVALGLETFTGTGRRFELVGSCNGAPVIDDYAHHPTEIAATLSSARLQTNGTVWGVFQPHTFSRAINCLEGFGKAFKNCDKIIVTDIYAAREADNGEINSRLISDYFTECGLDSKYVKDFTEIAIFLKKNVKKDDIVLTLGAGDVNKIAKMITM